MNKVVIAVFLALAAVGACLLLRAPAFDTEELRDLLDIFERKTASMHQGRFNYPLPRPDHGRAEIEYLNDLAGLLLHPHVDCAAAGRKIEERFLAFRAKNTPSVFAHAAYLLRRRQGADWVHSTSQEISDSPFSINSRVRVEPLDADKKFEILKEKSDRIELVTRAGQALRTAIDRAGPFAEECPDEAVGLLEALSYSLPVKN